MHENIDNIKENVNGIYRIALDVNNAFKVDIVNKQEIWKDVSVKNRVRRDVKVQNYRVCSGKSHLLLGEINKCFNAGMPKKLALKCKFSTEVTCYLQPGKYYWNCPHQSGRPHCCYPKCMI